MFCVHLPRLLLNCMMKHSPTSTKVSISVLRNLFVAGNKLTAAENKNHRKVIHFLLSHVLVVLVFSNLIDRIYRRYCKCFILD